MTKAEFYARRATADYLKTHAVTVVPPNRRPLATVQRRYHQGKQQPAPTTRASQMTAHAVDSETGEAVPITAARRLSRRIGKADG